MHSTSAKRESATLAKRAARGSNRKSKKPEIQDYFDLDESKPRAICRVRGCCNKRSPQSRICRRCRDRQYKERNPVSYAFDKLKQSAKRRGHSFDLTVAQLEMFFEANPELYTMRGRTAQCLSIDRIDATKGYSVDNLQVLTVSENGRKAHIDYLRTTELAYGSEEHPFAS